MLKLYIIGLSILLVAIIANFIAAKLGLMSWYDFLNLLTAKGTATFKEVRFFDYLWLFIIYPMALGSGYGIGHKLFQLIFT